MSDERDHTEERAVEADQRREEEAEWAASTGVTHTWDSRWNELATHMPGFTGLIEAVQGLLVGWSLATGEVWCTTDAAQTRALAVDFARVQLPAMVEAWGVEQ